LASSVAIDAGLLLHDETDGNMVAPETFEWPMPRP
jgi:hypothetical protein